MATPHAQVLVPQANAWAAAHFTYAVPAELAEQIAVGQSVVVPFGTRLTLGIVWSLTDAPTLTTAPIRAIHEILDPIPLIDAPRRALAEWLAEAYVCSLVDAVRMIVPGMTSAPRIDLIAAPATPDSVPLTAASDDPETRALLGLLRQRGTIEESVVRRALGPKRAGALITAMEARGAVSRAVHAIAAPVGSDMLVSLCAPPAAIATWREDLQARLTGPVPANVIPLRPRQASAATSHGKRGRGSFLREIAGNTGKKAQVL